MHTSDRPANLHTWNGERYLSCFRRDTTKTVLTHANEIVFYIYKRDDNNQRNVRMYANEAAQLKWNMKHLQM